MRVAQAFVAFAFLSVSGAALAQQGITPVPKLPAGAKPAMQLTVPASKEGLAYKLPADLAAKPVVLTAPQLDMAKQRKIAIAGQWGLAITQANLKSTFWLTPLLPADTGGAQLDVANDGPAGIDYATSAQMPYGSLSLKRTPDGQSWIGLNGIPASPKDWLLVDCYVANASQFTMTASIVRTPGTRDRIPMIERNRLVPSEGRVAVLFEPSAVSSRRVSVRGTGPAGSWNWGGCEVTAIQL